MGGPDPCVSATLGNGRIFVKPQDTAGTETGNIPAVSSTGMNFERRRTGTALSEGKPESSLRRRATDAAGMSMGRSLGTMDQASPRPDFYDAMRCEPTETGPIRRWNLYSTETRSKS